MTILSRLIGICLQSIRVFLWACLVVGVFSSPSLQAQVRSDERVVFFPSAARQIPGGVDWIVPIHGWIFEPESGDLLRNAAVEPLSRLIGLRSGASNSPIFAARCRLFLADNERGKNIDVRVGGQSYRFGPSTEDGHFSGEITIPENIVAQLARAGWLGYRAELPADDKRNFSGTAILIPPTGLSVISDIDDTIKISEVTDKRKLLENTFLNEYRAVDGMAPLYQQWANAGTAIHYVSSSPWQLFEPLQQFTDKAGFPPAVFHLKQFRVKNARGETGWQNIFADPLTTKPPVIESILQWYPQRRFVLVGDSGEHDPEVYGLVARRFPQQIRKIFIRDVTNEAPTSDRYRQAFEGIPANVWQVFRESTELRVES